MILPPELQHHLHQSLAELDRNDRQREREAESKRRRSGRTAPAGFVFLDRAAHVIAGDGVPGDGLEKLESVDEPRQRQYGPWRDALLRSARAGAIAAFDELSRAPAGPESASEDSLLRIDDVNRWLEMQHCKLRLAADMASAQPRSEVKLSDDQPNAATPYFDRLATAAQHGMPTSDLAEAFDALGWNRAGWMSLLNRGNPPPWLMACRVSEGVRGNGGGQATWDPVGIASALVKGRKRGGTDGSRKMGKPAYNDIRKAFSNRPLLREFGEAWKREMQDLDPLYGDD